MFRRSFALLALFVCAALPASLPAQTCAPNCWVLDGRIIGPDGEGVANVDLDLIDTSSGLPVLLSGDTTDIDGFFSMTLQETVLVGFYDVLVNPPTGGSYFPATSPDHFLSGSASLGDIAIERGSLLTGRVVDELGNGIAAIDLNFFDPVTTIEVPFGGDVTDVDGNFSVLVTPANYDVEFRTTPATLGGPYVPVELSAVPLTADIALGDVTFFDGHVLIGHVVDTGNTPIAGADIDVRDPISGDSIVTPSDNTDASGNFSVLVPTGPWVVEVDPPLTSTLVAKFVGVTIVAGVSNNLGTVQLPAGVNYSGITVDALGTPVPEVDLDFVISATQLEIATAHDNADAAGNFSVQVEPEVYDVQFRPPFASGLAPLVLAAQAITADTPAGAIELPAGIALTGTITESGTPVPLAEITLEQTGTGTKVYTFGNDTNAAGDYALRQVAGTYDVVITPPVASGLAAVTIAAVDLSADTVLDHDFGSGPTPPAPVSALICLDGASGPALSWTNGAADYDTIAVSRDGVVIATLAGTATTFSDATLPAATYAYAVTPVRGGLSGTATTCDVTVVPPPAGTFLRGDANGSGVVDVADAITTLGFLFGTAAAPACLDAADANDSGAVNIADPIHLLGYLFAGEAPPAAPFPAPGADPTADALPACP